MIGVVGTLALSRAGWADSSRSETVVVVGTEYVFSLNHLKAAALPPPRVHPAWVMSKLERLDDLLRRDPQRAKVEIPQRRAAGRDQRPRKERQPGTPGGCLSTGGARGRTADGQGACLLGTPLPYPVSFAFSSQTGMPISRYMVVAVARCSRACSRSPVCA